jgi:hypothetical protein
VRAAAPRGSPPVGWLRRADYCATATLPLQLRMEFRTVTAIRTEPRKYGGSYRPRGLEPRVDGIVLKPELRKLEKPLQANCAAYPNGHPFPVISCVSCPDCGSHEPKSWLPSCDESAEARGDCTDKPER